MNYYNEHDPKAAAWLRELIKAGEIPPGNVDERDIQNVKAHELTTYTQCHFFAGIGGWSLALRLAGWPDDDPVWTGSCPCGPFSEAGDGLCELDERHLWPDFRNLIVQCRPAIVFGEQVASPAGIRWLSGVRANMERAAYAFGAANLCAYAVGAPHQRQRSYWAAYSTSDGCQGLQRSIKTQVPKDWPSKTLDAWNGTGNPFEQWQELLAGTCVRRMADGISSNLDIRPALRAYGNAIVPQEAAAFVQASVMAFASL